MTNYDFRMSNILTSQDNDGGPNLSARNDAEDRFWRSRRHERESFMRHGCHRLWDYSPDHNELERAYEEHLKAEKDLAEELSRDVISEKQNINAKKAKTAKNRRSSSKSSTLSSDTLSSSSSDKKEKSKRKKHKRKDHHRKKSHKKEKREGSKKRSRINLSPDSDEKVIEKKHKKNKKEEKATSGGAGEEEDEWVELTKELRNEEAQKVRQEEAQIIGPQIPEHLLQKSDSTPQEVHLNADERKNMRRGEAAAMAAYAAQGKRIPRRGEIGLTSDEIGEFEKMGYVMSGTRHKSMEATRLRKENQILTAEEKRMLSSFSYEQRKQKEESVLNQFRNLITSKKTNT